MSHIRQSSFLRGIIACLLMASLSQGAILLQLHPATVMAQENEAQKYARIIATDGRIQGRGYDTIYAQLLRKGKQPLDAYRATYIYGRGFELGYTYYAIRAISGQEPSDKYEAHYQALRNFQQEPWSSQLWGWYEQGFIDGQMRGYAVAGKTEQGDLQKVPQISESDLGRYQRSLNIDPDDPWSDLRVRERITGPH
jgi:hypothetical protein